MRRNKELRNGTELAIFRAGFVVLVLIAGIAAIGFQSPGVFGQDGDIKKLISQLIDGSEEKREDAVKALALKGDSVLLELFRTFDENNELQRKNIVRVLGLLRVTRAKNNQNPAVIKIEDFLLKVLPDSNEGLQIQIIGAMAGLPPRSKRAIAPIVEFAKNENAGTNVRTLSVIYLGKYGPEAIEASSALIKILGNSDSNDEIRSAVPETLSKIDPKNKDAILAYRKIVVNSNEGGYVRAAAAART